MAADGREVVLSTNTGNKSLYRLDETLGLVLKVQLDVNVSRALRKQRRDNRLYYLKFFKVTVLRSHAIS